MTILTAQSGNVKVTRTIYSTKGVDIVKEQRDLQHRANMLDCGTWRQFHWKLLE